MRVTDVEESDTHVIIGKQKSASYSISNNAHMFNILFNKLYSDKILAPIRETICNAWDIHIRMGITNIPIDITLTEDTFTVKDYGCGLSPDSVEHHYCVAGASSKETLSNETGGFGLGCKSPFAYTDFFTITSCFNGTKTVYTASRNQEGGDGIPQIITNVSAPTDETGMTISMPINKNDYNNFYIKIINMVRGGGILAKFNGQLITNILSEEKFVDGYAIHTSSPYSVRNTINIRYGNVIYPVILEKVYDTLKPIPNKNMATVLLAQPDTISVVPSREALEYTEQTISTVKELIDKHLLIWEKEVPVDKIQYILNKNIKENIKNITFTDIIDILLSFTDYYRSGLNKLIKKPSNTSEQGFITQNTQDKVIYTKTDYLIYCIEENTYSNQTMNDSIYSYIYKTFINQCKIKFPSEKKFWNRLKKLTFDAKQTHNRLNNENICKLLYRRIYEKGLINKYNQLSYIIKSFSSALIVYTNSVDFYKESRNRCINQSSIIIAYNKTSINEYLSKYSGDKGFRFKLFTRKQDKEIKEFISDFEGINLNVIDLTSDANYNQPLTKKAQSKAYTPRVKGKPTIRSLINDPVSLKSDRIDDPQYIIKVTTNNSVKNIYPFTTKNEYLALAKYYPKTVIANDINQYNRWMSSNPKLIPLTTQIINDIENITSDNTKFVISSFIRDEPLNKLYILCSMSPELRKEFNIPVLIDEKTYDMIPVYTRMHYYSGTVRKIFNEYFLIKMDLPKFTEMRSTNNNNNELTSMFIESNFDKIISNAITNEVSSNLVSILRTYLGLIK